MRSIEELTNMQKQKVEEYNQLEKCTQLNNSEKEEKLIIAGTWIDFIDNLLDYNLVEFMENNGYSNEDIEKLISNRKVQEQILITEEQAKIELECKEKHCKEHPYGVVQNNISNGIYIKKIELDILKWVLEIE